MSANEPAPDGLRLPLGQVTVLLGSATGRRDLLARLDDGSARCAAGHAMRNGACRLGPGGDVAERLETVADAGRAALVLVDRLTNGLDAPQRRAVLAALRPLAAAGAAVLVDDIDPVAALAVADGALRVGADGSVVAEDLGLLRV